MDVKLQKLLLRLVENKVDMVLVGGYAAIFHGSALMTQDVDIAISMEPQNLKKLFQALHDLHPRHRVGLNKRLFVEKDTNDPHWENLYLMTDWGQLDCLGNVKGVGDFAQVVESAEFVLFQGVQVPIISAPLLIAAKNAIGRPKDIHVVRELEAILALQKKANQND